MLLIKQTNNFWLKFGIIQFGKYSLVPEFIRYFYQSNGNRSI